MRYVTAKHLTRFATYLSLLASVPALTAMQTVRRPPGLQDAGVRVETARSQLGSRLPALLHRSDPCSPEPGLARLPVEGFVLHELHPHPWPSPDPVVGTNPLATRSWREPDAGRPLEAAKLAAELVREPLVHPELSPRPWPAPPAVRAWLGPTPVVRVRPEPPALAPVIVPSEARVAVTLAAMPWPFPEEAEPRGAPASCPVA